MWCNPVIGVRVAIFISRLTPNSYINNCRVCVKTVGLEFPKCSTRDILTFANCELKVSSCSA